MTPDDLRDLAYARSKLEHPSLMARIANLVGRPLEFAFKLMPESWNRRIGGITHDALLKGLDFSINTLGASAPQPSHDQLHRVLVIGSGVLGGSMGVATIAVELPVSTCIILRSIADIARSEGHDISALDVRLACLEVLALGGRSKADDATDNGYFAVRAALARSVSEAATFISERGIADQGAPPLARLVAAIASRFGADVAEEVAAKAVPVVGALSGATVNLLFMQHFQDMARGHFIVKRLEKTYGPEQVEAVYRQLAG